MNALNNTRDISQSSNIPVLKGRSGRDKYSRPRTEWRRCWNGTDTRRCGGMAKEKLTLQEQANKILEQAQERGVSSNFFFVTTFKRYQVQMKILSDLEKAINDYGATVTKEYVKGRQNLVSNPAITEYNKTSTAANGTVATLINIVKTLSDEPKEGNKLQDLLAALNDE